MSYWANGMRGSERDMGLTRGLESKYPHNEALCGVSLSLSLPLILLHQPQLQLEPITTQFWVVWEPASNTRNTLPMLPTLACNLTSLIVWSSYATLIVFGVFLFYLARSDNNRRKLGRDSDRVTIMSGSTSLDWVVNESVGAWQRGAQLMYRLFQGRLDVLRCLSTEEIFRSAPYSRLASRYA